MSIVLSRPLFRNSLPEADNGIDILTLKQNKYIVYSLSLPPVFLLPPLTPSFPPYRPAHQGGGAAGGASLVPVAPLEFGAGGMKSGRYVTATAMTAHIDHWELH